MTVRFDESLSILARAVVDDAGETVLTSGIVLRDAMGRLAFFASTDLDEAAIERLSARLRKDLGPYARGDRVVAGASDFGAEVVLHDPSAFVIDIGGISTSLVDRRLVGADWLRAPAPVTSPPPRFIFASLKGGVGRSTALSVAAADLASHGRRVLAIDFDMEAPGLGAILLDEGTLPEFGLIDALVESGLSPLNEGFLADLVGPSALSDQRGRIDVIPAFGRCSIRNPGNVLAKIARAYVEHVRPDGTVATILDQVSALVDSFSDPSRYDAILVDARAGLHETTPSAILGLGAEVLLFGLDEPQTFQGYAALLAHLAHFIRPNEPAPEWLTRITMVQGKAPTEVDERVGFADKCRKLFADVGLGPRQSATTDVESEPVVSFKDIPWDDDARDEDVLPDEEWQPREPLAVLDDPRFKRFDPLRRHNLLSEQVYRSSFAQVLDQINEIVSPEQQEPK